MASGIRRRWQDFKKGHPAFERSKLFKSDVGPQLDKFDKLCDEFAELTDQLNNKKKEALAAGRSVAAALKGYEKVVNDLKDSDKSILTDFNRLGFDRFEDIYLPNFT